MKIRDFAASVDFPVIGGLHRLPDLDGHKFYVDDARNEYLVTPNGGISIVTKDGGVI